jgi:hypothetical protein
MDQRQRGISLPGHGDQAPQPFQFPPSNLMLDQFGGQAPQNMSMTAAAPHYPYLAVSPIPVASVYQGPIPQPVALPLGSAVGLPQDAPTIAPQAHPEVAHRSSMTLEKVIDPKTMPITSLAKDKKLPKWGVLKISNVSD